jgi:hypothetical protein
MRGALPRVLPRARKGIMIFSGTAIGATMSSNTVSANGELVDTLVSAVLARLGGSPVLSGGGAGGPGTIGGPAELPVGLLVPRLDLAHVELTQSTQYCSAAGGGYGPDNGVPLVALKALVARAYPTVSPGLLSADPITGQRVTGELVLSVGSRVVYRTGPTASNGVRVGRERDLDRRTWDTESAVLSRSGWPLRHQNTPLNFIVPAYLCSSGGAQVEVRVWTLDDTARASWSERVWFTDVGAPRVCLVRVGWTDSAGTRSVASDGAMLASLAQPARMLPFPSFSTTVLTVQVESTAAFGSSASSPGGCNPAWASLLGQLGLLELFTALFGLGDLVIGLVPSAALPTSGPYVAGCGRGAIGAFVSQPVTLAHELGHLYGRSHVAVAGDASDDTAYPAYGGDGRSIGEVGIDTGTTPPTLFDPAASDDLMSYGANQWISPYTYTAIMAARDRHSSARPIVGRFDRLVLVVGVRLYRDGTVVLRHAHLIAAPGQASQRWKGTTSPLSVDVLDHDGAVLLTHHLTETPAQGCGHAGSGCGCGGVPAGREPWRDLDEAIEWPAGAGSLSFHTGDEPLLVVHASEGPDLTVSQPDITNGQLRLRVTARHPRETPSVVVLFTGDGGTTWWPIAVDPDGDVVLEVATLPARGVSRFRVVATAELSPTVVETEPIELTPTPLAAHLEVSTGTCGCTSGEVTLAAHLDLRGHDAPPERALHWSSSLDGDLGVGRNLTPTLSRGQHELSFTSPDGLGGTITEHAIIIVSG